MNIPSSRSVNLWFGRLPERILATALILWPSMGVCQIPYRYFSEPEQKVLETTIQHARDELQKNPNNASAYAELGEHYLSKDELTSAIKYFKKALSLEPHEPRHMGNLATALCLAGDESSAASLFDRCIAAAPREPRWVLSKAKCLLQHEHKEEVRHIMKAVESIEFRDDVHLYKLRGRLFLALGEPARAEQDLRRYVQELGSDPEGHFLLGVAFLDKGDLEEAIRNITVAVVDCDWVPEFYRKRAEAYDRAGKAELAARDIEKARLLERK